MDVILPKISTKTHAQLICSNCQGSGVLEISPGYFIPCPLCAEASIPRAPSLADLSAWGTKQDKNAWRGILQAASEYVSNPSRRWLVLYGGTGCGKTTLANAIASEMRRLVRSVPVVSCLDIPVAAQSAHQWSTDKTECAYLIIDDVGFEPPSPHAQHALLRVAAKRHEQRLSTVWCVGVHRRDLNIYLSSRLWDKAIGRVLLLPNRTLRDED